MRGVVLAILLLVGCRSAEQQREINYLNNMLYDLENPTPGNNSLRKTWCQDSAAKADAWRVIPGWNTKQKVDHYLKACSQEQR